MKSEVDTDPKKIEELLSRGVEEVIGLADLQKKLASGKRLRVKFGIDPTSPFIHLGRAIPLLKLRDFQALGHQVVFIVGDFTGMVGDTSDKESERPMLSQATIDENKKRYFEQAGKVIDINEAELRYNSEWLNQLTYREIGEHADQFSVADFIARENIRKRLDEGKRVSLREVLYPLLQGYDSVAVNADVEIGGTDQRFNLLAGRTLQTHFKQAPQAVLTGPLIEGLDGRKMSSSWGNTITLDAEASDMYGKIMSLHDSLVAKYFLLCTRLSLQELHEIQHMLTNGTLHPKDAKMRLAREIVTMYHGTTAAQEAEVAFVHTFSERKIPDSVPEVEGARGSLLVDILLQEGVVTSKADFRRLVEGGAITLPEKNNTPLTDGATILNETLLLKVGKRRFVKVVVT